MVCESCKIKLFRPVGAAFPHGGHSGVKAGRHCQPAHSLVIRMPVFPVGRENDARFHFSDQSDQGQALPVVRARCGCPEKKGKSGRKVPTDGRLFPFPAF